MDLAEEHPSKRKREIRALDMISSIPDDESGSYYHRHHHMLLRLCSFSTRSQFLSVFRFWRDTPAIHANLRATLAVAALMRRENRDYFHHLSETNQSRAYPSEMQNHYLLCPRLRIWDCQLARLRLR
jgi:hypothetical protein